MKGLKRFAALALAAGMLGGFGLTARAETWDTLAVRIGLYTTGYSRKVPVTMTPKSDYGMNVRRADRPDAGIGMELTEEGYAGNRSGSVRFPSLRFYKEGDYEFRFTAGGDPSEGTIADGRPITMKVSVTKNSLGQLKASPSWEQDGDAAASPRFIYRQREDTSPGDSQKARAEKLLAAMPLEDKVGQLFVTHFDGGASFSDPEKELARAKELITQYRPGGILLFKWNCQNDTPETLKQRIGEAQGASKLPLSVQVDEEGGRVTRVSCLPAFRSSAFKAPQDVLGEDRVLDDAAEKARFLKNLGFNMNLAPVADVASGGYIYDRTYGGDGITNGEAVRDAVQGHRSVSGMGSCLKHFPGYGSTSSNTHNGFAVNDLSRKDFEYNDLLPFYSGIAAGTDMVLVTHNIVNCMDAKNPASLSPAVYQCLREEVGFDRVAITDDLGMKAVTDHIGSGKSAAGEAVKAGADMVITAKMAEEYPKVLAMARSGELPMERIDEAVTRILVHKIRLGLIQSGDMEDYFDGEARYLDAGGTLRASGTLEEMWDYASGRTGGTIRLVQDVEAAGPLSASGKDIILDLDGHRLAHTGNGVLFSLSGGSLIIKDGKKAPLCIKEEVSYGGNYCSGTEADGKATYAVKAWDKARQFSLDEQETGRISGNGRGRLIEARDATLTVENIGMLDAGNSAISASGKGSVTIKDSYFGKNKGPDGGAVQISGKDCALSVQNAYFLFNRAAGRGGAIKTDGRVSLADVHLLLNSALSGGAVHGGSLSLSSSFVGWNTASQDAGGAHALEGVQIAGTSFIVGNEAKAHGGGVYVEGMENSLGGCLTTEENRSLDGYSGLYLKKGRTFRAEGELSPSSHIVIRTESTDDEIPIIAPGGTALSRGDLPVFEPGDASYSPALDLGGVTFVKDREASIPYGVLMDGVFLQAGTIKSLSGAGINTAGEPRRYYTDLSKLLGPLKAYGFSEKQLAGRAFGILEGGRVAVPEEAPEKVGSQSRMYLAGDEKLVYLPNLGVPGAEALSEAAEKNGFWTIDVRDIRALTLNPGSTPETDVQFVKSGGGKSLSLPDYGGFWDWRAITGEGTRFEASFTKKDGKVQADVRNVYSPVVITNGTEKDLMYTVQCFAYVDTFDLSDSERSDRLPVIDTTGGSLPKNQPEQTVKYLTVDTANGNRILKNRNLTRMYDDSRYVYRVSPRLTQADRMKENVGFELSEVWVLKEGRNLESMDPEDFIRYRRDELPELDSLRELKLTTNPEKGNATTIVIREGSVLRFIYEPKPAESSIDATFHDYDITDGHVYDSPSRSDPKPTSTQDSYQPVYSFTQRQGINHPDNYHGNEGDGKMGFGNANTKMGLETEKTKDGYFINQANRNTVYKLCCFGLVDGILGDEASGFYPKYADGVSAPGLFQQGETKGRTTYGDVLTFSRSGDSYVLDRVGDTGAKDLGTFGHPISGSGTEYTSIWTNDFWPMDDFPSFGGDGHDLKFGKYFPWNSRDNRKYFASTGSWAYAASDDGKDHNAYFGMTSTLEFTMPAGYQGPMEYVFFGDDDMWLFLDDTLVLDIGGVHSSVGEYVNLWDYLEKSDTAQKHRLTLFYTERGASGSTCFMGFNIPGVEGESARLPEGQIDLAKEVAGAFAPAGGEYEFQLTLTDRNGNAPLDDYSVQKRDADEKILDYGILEGGIGTFTIRAGEHLYLPELPEGYRYQITETPGDYETSFGEGGIWTDGNETSGTIEGDRTRRITCRNSYSGAVLPDTGRASLLWAALSGTTLLWGGILAFWLLKRKHH